MEQAASDPVFAAFCTAGLWPGLGRTTAERLPAAGVLGPADVTRDRLVAVEGVSPARAERLVRSFDDAADVYAVAGLLHRADLPTRLAAAARSGLGPSAAAVLVDDPWRLLDVTDLPPRQVDVFALRTLADRPGKDDPRRGRAFTAHVLARAARDGHTLLPEGMVLAALAGLDVPAPDEGVAAALRSGTVSDAGPGPDGVRRLALRRYDEAERAVAEHVRRLTATAKPLSTPEGAVSVTGGLDPAQRAAVQSIAASGLALLTGGPGTGKSRTVAAVVALAEARHRRVALAAPTGRAAKRLEELAGATGSTVHRLLGAQGTTGEFLRSASWPLDEEVVVVDETSMLDVELAAALLAACADGTHLLLVGDPAQLPSIGPGRVLGDLIAAGTVPVTELTTLHRQAEGGAIARLAAAVRDGMLPPVTDEAREVVVVPAADSATAARRVQQLVTDSIPRVLGIASEDVQVVTPVHRGPAGTIDLNVALKAALNPGPGRLAGFDVGDRVVATANHLDDGFANGEVGTVLDIGDGALTVSFAGEPVTVPAAHLGDIRHGWAVTVHRAQGSEWPAVVAVMPREASGLMSRPLVYTAFTRAQRHLSIVHAAGPLLARAVREVGARPRRTRLAELLRAEDREQEPTE